MIQSLCFRIEYMKTKMGKEGVERWYPCHPFASTKKPMREPKQGPDKGQKALDRRRHIMPPGEKVHASKRLLIGDR